ncbi:TNT domain-containing protein [Labedaea rhizosphaerae]|uniref:Uncharacterized protein DUF4237 n=1 Tax=Labedaea rhizosphaerae TaxID=598644 RepID=A0A4R6S272_LABRH|nr:TNT domain-containing protein [Labedaea rhizosphaerae]TDP93662.1 uncharacterized protein DUF4237 [Labedaea rhizosphaerae]
MGIELPQELVGVAQAAGVHWPQADEDKMRDAAQAWRDAGAKLDTLVTDSDKTARTTLTHMHGEAGTAATRHWSTFVAPDTGHLTATAKGCTAAADRLEHAADQVGIAKTEIVRQLVALASNTDAAHTAAASGHPTALAGLDTFVKGTAANVATINHSLVDAVRPGSGVDVGATHLPTHAGPGEHGVVDNLLTNTTNVVAPTHGHGMVSDTVQGATNLVGDTTHGATTLVDHTTQGATNLVDGTVHGATGQGATGQGHGPVGDLAQGATNLVDGTVQGVTGHGHGGVAEVSQGATNLVDGTVHDVTGHGPVGDLGPGATNLVDNTAQGATNLVDPGHGHVPYATAGDITAGDTGPIPAQPDAPTPHTGLPHPVNQVVAAAGLADAPPVANLPGNAAPGGTPFPGAAQGGLPQPGAQPGGGYFGGGPGGGPIAGGGFGGAPVGGAVPGGGTVGGPVGGPGGSPVGGAQPAAPLNRGPGGSSTGGPGVPPVREPLAGTPGTPGTPGAPGRPGTPSGPGAPGGQVGAGLGQARGAGPLVGAQQPGTQLPGADRLPPAPALPPGHKTEREQLVAVLLVHMFPFGHMPVAATEPARQLPTPPPELDYAPGLRFAPDDHPQSHLVGAAVPPEQVPVVEPLTSESAVVQDLLTGHDSLGELHERDWDRKFLVRPAGPEGDAEYAWPPGELYPEGGTAPGEPEVLDAGTVLDRFGREDGRVFAAAGTPFAQRALPPSHVDLEYRRYRVVEPIPVWRSVSAAWFAQPGGGVRYRSTRSAAELVALGHLEDVTRAEEGTP